MSIAKAKVYSDWLDEVYNATSTTLDWENNPNIRMTGGATVSIPTITTAGNRTYDRDNGFSRSTGSLTWKDYAFDYDRSFEYLVDAMDQDETGNVLTVGATLKNHVENQEVPEVDAIRYSGIFQNIVNDDVTRYGYYDPVKATVYSQFMADVTNIRKTKGHVPLRAKMTETAFSVLSDSSEISKQMIVQVTNGTNEISTETYKINGVEIDTVVDDRMVTEIELLEPGFETKAWAQQMNWVIYSPGSIVAAKKRNAVKNFPNGSHTEGDGDLVQGRMYHGIWVLEHKKDLLYVSLKPAAAPTIVDLGGTVVAGAGKVTITLGDAYEKRDTGHTFYYYDTDSATAPDAPAVYDDLDVSGFTKIEVKTATDVTATATHYVQVVALDENSRVIGYSAVAAGA